MISSLCRDLLNDELLIRTIESMHIINLNLLLAVGKMIFVVVEVCAEPATFGDELDDRMAARDDPLVLILANAVSGDRFFLSFLLRDGFLVNEQRA